MTHEHHRIGPLPEKHRRDLERSVASLREGFKKYHEVETDLKEKYGADLVDFGKAYFDKGIAGWVVVVRGERISKDDVRPKFAAALTEALENQPSESKAEWLNNYLKDISDFGEI